MHSTNVGQLRVDVAIIGAGPAGAVAAGMLRKAGRSVLVLERQRFPRFSIGESLLPQSMHYLEEAGMLQTVIEAGFQFKNGAYFVHRDRTSSFDFREKYTPGWGTAYQVERAAFDDLLIQCAARQGAEVRFGHTVRAFTPGEQPALEVADEAGHAYKVKARFVLDASGFCRVLPRLLDLETPTHLPARAAIFTHVEDRLPAGSIDRDKICIAVHPQRRDVWFWMIPLTNGRSSVGCVAEMTFLDAAEDQLETTLRNLLQTEPTLARLVGNQPFVMPVRRIGGYASNVARLHGAGYALLGNAGEFLDPVFSSGVTIAMRSSHLAVGVLDRYLQGEAVDWQRDYDDPLRRGIDTFRTFVERWYSGELQDIIFYENQSREIKRMICAILAGYAWDESNPYVQEPVRRLQTLSEVCKSAAL